MKTFEEPGTQVDELARAVIGAAIEAHRPAGLGVWRFGSSAGGAAENSPRRQPWVEGWMAKQPRTGRKKRQIGAGNFLPPLAGLEFIPCRNPRLTPWAMIFRRSAAVISYLKSTRLSLGLLINFNVPVLRDGVCRVVHSKDQPPRREERQEKFN
jgi:hypothetical protein